jgi:hypothetical protein
VLETRDPVTGERKRKWHTYAGPDGTLPPKKAAEAECRRLVTALEGGTSIDATKETVAAFFERWIEHMQGQVSPRSHERYAEIARKNLAPRLGGLQLTKLKPEHISAAYAKALTTGHRKTGRRAPLPTCIAFCGRRYSKPCCGRQSRAIPPIS